MSDDSPSLGSAPAAMSLRDGTDSTTSSETKPEFPSVPYEITLLICQALVDLAYIDACKDPITWQITAPKADASSAPVYVVTDKHRQRPKDAMQRRMNRFNKLRLINKATRRMVDRACPRAVLYHQADWGDDNDHDVKEAMPQIWICPEADI